MSNPRRRQLFKQKNDPAAEKRRTKIEEIWPSIRNNRNYRVDEIRELGESDWQELVRRVRGRIRGGGKPDSVEAKAYFRNLKRRLAKRPGERHIPLRKDLLIRTWKECSILDSLVSERKSIWQPIIKRKVRPVIRLRDFTFIGNAVGTMRQLAEIANAEAIARSVSVSFLDELCLDVSPYLVLGLMRTNMAPVLAGGQITPTIRSMVTALELRSFLNMNPIKGERRDPSFSPFKVRYSRERPNDSKNTAFQPSAIEKLCDDLVATVDQWLVTQKGILLTKTGKANVSKIVNEPLDNGVRHADLGGNGNWATAGFLSRVVREEPGGSRREVTVCSLSIVSTGATMAETILTCKNPVTLEKIRAYVARHRQGELTEELLAMVYALQDGVSRFIQGDEDSRGGVGIMDMLQMVMELGQTNYSEDVPTVALISGKSCIIVRPPFAPLPPQPGTRSPREVWFNDANSVDFPPDANHVFSLPYAFPGTIVAIRFCLDRTFVAKPIGQN